MSRPADHHPRALEGVRVLDLSQSHGYASKLFADLGADVTLVEPPKGIALRRHAPFLRDQAGEDRSLRFQYLSAGKRSVVVDFDRGDGRALFRAMLSRTDIVIDDRQQSCWRERDLAYAQVAAINPALVWCAITPFGQNSAGRSDQVDDMVAMCAGGMAWLTGYDDTGPLVVEGDLALYSSAQYAAVMSLIGYLGRETIGGQLIDVSMQEVVALGTETAPQFLTLRGVERRRLGEDERQAGIGVYPCRDGFVLLYAADSGLGTGWSDLVAWLHENNAPDAESLADPQWHDNAFKAKPESKARFRQIFLAFSMTRGKQELFEEGQARHIAIAPINQSGEAYNDPHLNACGYFTRIGEIDGEPLHGPGAPYHLSRTPWSAGMRAPRLGEHTEQVRCDVSQATGPALRAHRSRSNAGLLPLAGLRIIDFTWVGAGPFTTKILADFGAEVIKIESVTRPDQLRRAEPLVGSRGLEESGYFAVRNTNKKSVSINMKASGAREVILAMVRNADVMANSFSPKAMRKFGLEYHDVAAVNPAMIFLSMPMAGSTGAYSNYIGYGMSIAAIGGMFGLGGKPGRRPVGTGTNFPDHLPNPLHAAFTVLAALAYRRRSGQGQEIEISQIESTISSFPDAILDYAAHGRVRSPGCGEEVDGQRGIYRCAGADRWCAISAADAASVACLCEVIGRRDLAVRGKGPMLEAAIQAWAADLEAEVVERRLLMAGVPASIVAKPADLLKQDGRLARRGFWQSLDHPVMGRMVYHGIAAKFSTTPTAYRTGAPLLGQHNFELPDLTGMSSEACSALAVAGVIK